jgi:diaminopimelate epimerase
LTHPLSHPILATMKTYSFAKYSGNGNDFVMVSSEEALTKDTVIQFCDRHFGIGADGVITLGSSSKADGRMRIYNADGGEAEMCGNGLRCLATYMDERKTHKKDSYLIETMNAVYPVLRKGQSFKIEMAEIKDKNLFDLSGFKDFQKSFYINTGVPHLIFLASDIKRIDLKKIAPFYRHHALFPKGTNVTLVEIKHGSHQEAYARTYERGVEDETFSCGTGLTATALALSDWFGWNGEISLVTKGGQHWVSIGDKIFYSGEVRKCFEGTINL